MRDRCAPAEEEIDVGGVDPHRVDAERIDEAHVVIHELHRTQAERHRGRDPALRPGIGEPTGAVVQEAGLFRRLGEMDREREPLLASPLPHLVVQRRAHGVRRMGRDADAQATRHLEWPKRRDGGLETRHALLDLRGMRTEDFLVCDAASAELGESLRHGAGVPGIGNGGDARGPAFPNALPGRLEELLLACARPSGPAGGESRRGNRARRALRRVR